MNSTQQRDASLRPVPAERDVPLRPEQDEEMALGCECANPVLQIEQWFADQGLQRGSASAWAKGY